MLEVSVSQVTFGYDKRSTVLRGVSCEIPRSMHIALSGPAGGGKSTLLSLISGTRLPSSGEIQIGSRSVSKLPHKKRPIFDPSIDSIPPPRWSVEHLLVSSVMRDGLDREQRKQEIDFVSEKWKVTRYLARQLQELSNGERLRARLAQIELLRPAIVVAERLFRDSSAGERLELAESFHATLRHLGSTMIAEPSDLDELRFYDAVFVLDAGTIVNRGTVYDVFFSPTSELDGEALGEVNRIPGIVRDGEVESVIGHWRTDDQLEGPVIALIRPADFVLARPGEDSDLILGIEHANFGRGTWHLSGFITGGILLRVEIDGSEPIHKGKLLPLRFDPGRVRLVAAGEAPPRTTLTGL